MKHDLYEHLGSSSPREIALIRMKALGLEVEDPNFQHDNEKTLPHQKSNEVQNSECKSFHIHSSILPSIHRLMCQTIYRLLTPTKSYSYYYLQRN